MATKNFITVELSLDDLHCLDHALSMAMMPRLGEEADPQDVELQARLEKLIELCTYHPHFVREVK